MADMDTDFRMKHEEGKGYALSGKIMLSAIVILFAVIIFMVGYHLYARWYVIHLRRRQLQHRRQRRGGGRPHIVLLADNRYTVSSGDRGLEKAVLDSLPVYHHSSKTGTPSECVVCLSELQEGEVVRHLPKCSHSFHTECIDMWFASHSTCPLCRSPVEQVVNQKSPALTINIQFDHVNEPHPGSSSRSKPTNPHQRDEVGGIASIGGRRKGLDLMAVRVEVPPRKPHSEDDSAQSSTGFRSPGNGLAYLRRMFTMSMRSPTSGAIPCDTGSGSNMDTNGDLESCTIGLSPDSSRVQTPR